MRNIYGKVVVLGSQGVGKTSIVKRYIEKKFNEHLNPTIGALFFSCNLDIEDARVMLMIWDTAGQERFRSMAPMYYRKANAAMLVFDLTQYSTFVAMKRWVEELQKNVEETMVLAVIGNKLDLMEERKVDAEEARVYARKIGASYHETSVLQSDGIENLFLSICTGILKLSSSSDLTSLRSIESIDLNLSDMDILSTPTIEETAKNVSTAHGIQAKSSRCC
ncbi:Ras-related protein RABF2a [Melipona quadrifasciata]|uniref:Ras-related protein RABF2a n=1 Tax=Melipona quadrifasciata TaxID=166423 RepID=A0A0M8ZP91_9HYME|nr:Ras-related protein RABF2a [Melipona quadrifasciata]